MKSPPSRKPRASAIATRRAIVDAALTIFSIHGYEGATTRKIAKEATLEHGHLAKYFRSKDDLWLEVVKSCHAEAQSVLDANLTAGPTRKPRGSRQQARIALSALLRFFAHNHRLTRLMLQEFSVSSPRHDWVVTHVGKPVWIRMQPLFDELFPPQDPLAREGAYAYFALIGSALLFFGSTQEIKVIAGLDPTDPAVVERYIEHVVESVLRPRQRQRAPGRTSLRTSLRTPLRTYPKTVK